ncbi:hypothetical protein TI06_23150, partial [Vibrio vulnificus]
DALVPGLAAGGHAVGLLVALVLVVEVDQEGAQFGAQDAVVVAAAEFPGAGLLRLDVAAAHRLAHLAVLHGAERGVGLGVEVPARSEVVDDV